RADSTRLARCIGCLCHRNPVHISGRYSFYCYCRYQTGVAHFQCAYRHIVILVWISFWPLCGTAAFDDRSGYGGGWNSLGEYCDSLWGVILTQGFWRSFTLLAVVAVAGGTLLFPDNYARGQAATGNYGGAISLGGHSLYSFEVAP